MRIFLLTHERELNRATNTGSIAIDHAAGIVERIVWERLNPHSEILSLIDDDKALLLHSNGSTDESIISEYENILIIDSTWQESQKIFNKSAYLKRAPQATLNVQQSSKYALRRNQPDGGLCTVECIIEVLKIKGQRQLAADLETRFIEFNVR